MTKKRFTKLVPLYVLMVMLVGITGCTPSAIPTPAPVPITAPIPIDSDGDGWSDAQEDNARTDPNEVDTDGDGYWDSKDANPLDKNIPSNTQTVAPSNSTPSNIASGTTATVSLDNTAVRVGDQVTVNGIGFLANAMVTITLNGIQVGSSVTGASGDFSVAVNIPSLPLGSYMVAVRDASNTATTHIVISGSTSLDKAYGASGETGTVSGQGPDGAVQIAYDGVHVATATVTGSVFSTSFLVPPSTAGKHVIVVTDGTNTMSFTFTVESQPPPVPIAISPVGVPTSADNMLFDWADVTDESGVTYNLQVATDPNMFANLVLNKIGMTDSSYQWLEAETLPSLGYGSYYWRVQAVDGASNYGDWCPPQLFLFVPPASPTT